MNTHEVPDTILYPKSDNPNVRIVPRQRWAIRDLMPEEHLWSNLGHPELAIIAARTRSLIDGDKLTQHERGRLYEVEGILRNSIQDFRWFFYRLDETRLLPGPAYHPDPKDIQDEMPNWETFAKLLGLIMRTWEFIERLEAKASLGREAH